MIHSMDAQNCYRMACLPPWVQRHVIYTHGPRAGKNVADPNRSFSDVIGGVRSLVRAELTQKESQRMIGLTKTGPRLSYLPCTYYRMQGWCEYGEACTHAHVR